MTVATFSDLYRHAVEAQGLNSYFLTGHLVVEFLLRRLVVITNPALENLADDLNHARLIKLNRDLGTITDQQMEVLVRINKVRNRMAHSLGYEPTIPELEDLFRLAGRAFSDLTDGISQGLSMLDGATQLSDLDGWEVPEFFIQIAYDLHIEFQNRGGDEENF